MGHYEMLASKMAPEPIVETIHQDLRTWADDHTAFSIGVYTALPPQSVDASPIVPAPPLPVLSGFFSTGDNTVHPSIPQRHRYRCHCPPPGRRGTVGEGRCWDSRRRRREQALKETHAACSNWHDYRRFTSAPECSFLHQAETATPRSSAVGWWYCASSDGGGGFADGGAEPRYVSAGGNGSAPRRAVRRRRRLAS